MAPLLSAAEARPPQGRSRKKVGEPSGRPPATPVRALTGPATGSAGSAPPVPKTSTIRRLPCCDARHRSASSYTAQEVCRRRRRGRAPCRGGAGPSRAAPAAGPRRVIPGPASRACGRRRSRPRRPGAAPAAVGDVAGEDAARDGIGWSLERLAGDKSTNRPGGDANERARWTHGGSPPCHDRRVPPCHQSKSPAPTSSC